MTHPRLWSALASAYPSLLHVTNGLRIFSTVLGVAIVLWWWSSAWRCLRGRPEEGDAHRAGLVPIAIAVLTFEGRWFAPILSDLQRGQLLVVAHGGMALGLLFGIYVHGRDQGGMRIKRAMYVYARQAWCIWTLEQSLATQEKRLSRLAADDPTLDDHVDLRDAIATLLHLQRSTTGMLLVELRRQPAAMRDAA